MKIQRNLTDPRNQIEVLIGTNEDEILCGLVLVDAIRDGARGRLCDIASCIRGKKEVVIVLKEEWDARNSKRKIPPYE